VPATPAGRGTQIQVERTDGSPVKRYKCSRCAIFYDTVETVAACPLCKMEIKADQALEALKNMRNQIDLLEKQNRELDSRVNIQSAFRAASDLLGTEDRVFLKQVLYTWRQDRSVSLKVIHTGEGGNRKATGFIAEWRGRDPEGHACSSIGGAAIAAAFEEALHTLGSAQAMQVLVRALQHLLPGEMA